MFNRKTLLLAFALCTAQFAMADDAVHAPELPQIPDAVFRVADHGVAVGESADNTKAIQTTIDAATAAGGGVVELPAGSICSGPIQFASKINLRLPAGTTLTMLPIDRYPGGTQKPEPFISGQHLHDIAITGGGMIDGQGAPWWPLAKTKDARRPSMIGFRGCDRVLIDGVKLQNSPMFHIAVGGKSSNVTVRGVTIRAPDSTDPDHPSHNTDACDVSGTHVLVENCDISVGDDDFTCGGGTSDVHIRHCKYGTGHGLSIGSPTTGGVWDILVEDCTFNGTDCGIRIKSDRDRGGDVHNLVYRNLTMKNVGMPILIYAAYNVTDRQFRDLNNLTAAIASTYPARPMSDRTPSYHDIVFSNITAEVTPGRRAGLIWGLPEAPATKILLQNVNIKADKPFAIFDAQDVRLENCKITTPQGENKLETAKAQVTIVPE